GDKNFLDYINPNSLTVLIDCKAERSVENASVPASYQFMRLGYFCLDKDSTKEKLIFNRSVSLKDGFKRK
ncbi:MAG: glutamine--tRNA ligase, partial [Clostridia bacterium]|nr:glutamine--tRNA ligase [Clostridia bacterium]